MAEPRTGVPVTESLFGGQLLGQLPDPNRAVTWQRNKLLLWPFKQRIENRNTWIKFPDLQWLENFMPLHYVNQSTNVLPFKKKI